MSNVAEIQQPQDTGLIASMATRLSVDAGDVEELVMNTLMKAKGQNGTVSRPEFITFMAIANEYRLNPINKEIYAFANRGAIQPIVSIDGWLKIINSNTHFDGMEFTDQLDDDGVISAVTCRIYRKDRSRAIEVTEYLSECQGTSEPWKKWPARMLRHKATIQCARYAFGLAGIMDPDEAERTQSVERDITPRSVEAVRPTLEQYPQDKFEANLPIWEKAIVAGKLTSEEVIRNAGTRGMLTNEQIEEINGAGQ